MENSMYQCLTMKVVVGSDHFQFSSKGALISLIQTTNFIDNRFQCFEDNNDKRIVPYKENMSESFKTILTLLLPKKVIIKKKIRQLSSQ